MTHLESRKKLSGSELHRTLPRTDVFTKVHFEDVGEIHIDMAIKQLCEGYAAAYRNTRHTSLMEFVLEHSRTMSMYDQAYKEMKDFKSLWHSDQKERALDKWRQWEQRSQTDLRDGDIASLAANAIRRINL